ncbi:MAG: hypothetical protein V1931_04435 [Candidatus Micrarchaeota archaeon]
MPIDSFYERGLLMRGLRSEHEAIAWSLLRKSINGEEIVSIRETAGKDGALVRRAFTELVTSHVLSETIIDAALPSSFGNCTYRVHPDQKKAVAFSLNEKNTRLKQKLRG